MSDHLGIPINEDYEFEICTPPKIRNSRFAPQPSSDEVLTVWIDPGPGHSVNPAYAPLITEEPVDQSALDLRFFGGGLAFIDPCANARFGPTKLRVRIPLASSGVAPDDVYAYKIYAGWVPPAENTLAIGPDQGPGTLGPIVGTHASLRHFEVRLDSMLVHNNHESGDGCECTFFWMNVDRASREWIRLSDFATGNMQNFRQGTSIGFEGATFDVFVQDGQPFTIRANGYDGGVGERSDTKDCLDNHMGHHDFAANENSDCYHELAYEQEIEGDTSGANLDPFHGLFATFDSANDYGVGEQILPSDPKCSGLFERVALPSFSAPRTEEIACDKKRQEAELSALADAGLRLRSSIRTEPSDYELRITITELPVFVPVPRRLPVRPVAQD